MTIAPMPRGTHTLSSAPINPAIDSPKPTTYNEHATAWRNVKLLKKSEMKSLKSISKED